MIPNLSLDISKLLPRRKDFFGKIWVRVRARKRSKDWNRVPMESDPDMARDTDRESV